MKKKTSPRYSLLLFIFSKVVIKILRPQTNPETINLLEVWSTYGVACLTIHNFTDPYVIIQTVWLKKVSGVFLIFHEKELLL
jgi:hypothetical protein